MQSLLKREENKQNLLKVNIARRLSPKFVINIIIYI
jgi:hypothetical protein